MRARNGWDDLTQARAEREWRPRVRIRHNIRMHSVASTLRNAADGSAGLREKVFRLGNHAFVADPSGALYWPQEHLLIVADLHLEKASAYAARRIFLPPYDTAATITRLAAAIDRLNPRRVIALGDSFHDDGGPDRLRPRDVQALRAAQIGREWLWIAGNHDPSRHAGIGGDHAHEIMIGPIALRHEPSPAGAPFEIAGHLHPVALVGGRGGATRRRCFWATDHRCVLPAFGAYAGGLNILDQAFRGLFLDQSPRAHVLGQDAVYTVAPHQCLADPANPHRLRH